MAMIRPGQLRFSIEHWKALWAKPHPDLACRTVTPDITASCAGDTDPVVGITGYRSMLVRVLRRIPDLHREAVAHAHNGDVLFVAWVARGTGKDGPFELGGVDHIRLRDGLIKEHHVYYDPTAAPNPCE